MTPTKLARRIAALTLAVVSLGALGAVRARRVAQTPPSASVQDAERARTPPGMVYVPGGWCFLGTDDPDAEDSVRPRRKVFVPSFYIDRTEVTCEAFQKFDPTYAFKKGNEKLPATAITFAQADAYARWAGKSVPTEAQWEKAARGTDGRRYPWGDVWDPKRVARRGKTLGVPVPEELKDKPTNACKLSPARVQPVGSVPAGASPYGCLDMAGNAWEWVAENYLGNPEMRILRGGAVGYSERACRTYLQAVEGSATTCNDTGFRCAQAVGPVP